MVYNCNNICFYADQFNIYAVYKSTGLIMYMYDVYRKRQVTHYRR